MGHAAGNHPGFAGSCSGNDEERALDGGDGFLLGGGQIVQQVLAQLRIILTVSVWISFAGNS